jgi:magnesium transporter
MGTTGLAFSGETRVKKHDDVAWIDVENPTGKVFDELETTYKLHPFHLNESTQKIQLTKVERERNYLFLLLHVPVAVAAENRFAMQQIGIFLGKNYLITIHDGPCPVVDELFNLFTRSTGHKKEYSTKGPAYLLYGVVKKLLDNLWDVSQGVMNDLDEIEGLVFDNNRSDAYQIGQARQRIMQLRRVIGSLRIMLDDLAQQVESFSGSHLAKYYSNNTKLANKLWEVIEEAKETVEIYKDADFTTSTEQTNEILAILTLVFTFTIPITVVASLYGMNVPLPGGNTTGAWTFLGKYTSFEILLTVSCLLALGMYLYFKKKRWF